MSKILEKLKLKKLLVSDGAWGTFLQAKGLQAGECPEAWNLNRSKDVLDIPKQYIEAGADIVLTNSFGASPFKLNHFGLADKVSEINEAAARISRKAAGENNLVFGSIGPTGVVLMMGEVSESDLFAGFSKQAAALARGGSDAICVETMSEIDEAVLAIRAVKENTDLEVVCTFTFQKTRQGDFRTMMGVSPAQMVEAVLQAGADVIGTNCGNGMKDMAEIVREIRKVEAEKPILVHANAGKPHLVEGKTIFPESPSEMASYVPSVIESGANIVGGCCGTNAQHIRKIAEVVRSL